MDDDDDDDRLMIRREKREDDEEEMDDDDDRLKSRREKREDDEDIYVYLKRDILGILKDLKIRLQIAKNSCQWKSHPFFFLVFLNFS